MADFSIPPYTVHYVGDIQQLSQVQSWSIKNMDIPDAWATTKGENVTIAVLDTGIGKHIDLADNVDYNSSKSFIPGEDIFQETPCHGMHVGGTIASIDNLIGVVGIAPKAKLIGLKVLDKNGMSQNNSILNALKYVETLDIDIINMSLGSQGQMEEEHEVIKRLVNDKGVVICAAAGNNGQEDILNPAGFPEVFAIGSYSDTPSLDRSSFSSWGDALDFLMPGDRILSCWCNNQYSISSGSSMACPHASGLIALLISKLKAEGKKLSVSEIKDILIKNCINVPVSGFDKYSGYGIISAKRLFQGIETYKDMPKPTIWQDIEDEFERIF